MLKKIPQEYTEELEYHKKTGYFTSSLILNCTMVFMDEILKGAPIDELAVSRLVAMGAKPEDAVDWKKAYDNYHIIEEKIKEFSDTCWFDIKRINDNSTWTCHRFVHEDLALVSMYTSGRILITIGPKVMDGKIYVSIVGDGTTPKGKEGTYKPTGSGSYRKKVSACGFQGIHAKKEEAIGFIDSIVSNWDKDKYCVHKSKKVSIC